ncbi:MAG: hypothetical protein K5978_03345 [Campylobacter sp.]|nr:hypothetical protein [Campylobacter sp.]
MISVEKLAKIASFFTPISHTPGRLRVRVSAKITQDFDANELSKIDSIIAKINGIKEVKFNKIIGSLTVFYDPQVFAQELWEDLLNGRNLQAISDKINDIAEQIA